MTAPTVDTPQPTVFDEDHPLAGVPMYADERRYVATLEADLLAARREVEALRAAATDCADDLESEIRARYGHPDIHPAMQGKYERDIEPVLAARAALAATPEEK